jgi:perosamine synthetase
MNFIDRIDKVLPRERPIGHHDAVIAFPGQHIIRELEAALAKYCGTRYAVAVSSGTAALHLALLGAGVKPGEEVLIPSLTFAATANAVLYCGATPHFVDSSWGINQFKLRSYLANATERTKDRRGRLNPTTKRVISALVVVDLLGFPADLIKLRAVADEFGLVMIEDAAQALGSSLETKKCGSFGLAGIFSFNNNKIITGNGGGAIVTDDEWLVAMASNLASQGRVPHPYEVMVDNVGYNYRMTGSSATMVLSQLVRMDMILEAKKQIHQKYKGALEGCEGIKFMTVKEPWQGEPNYWLNALELDWSEDLDAKRETALKELHSRGIQARAMFAPLHQQTPYKKCPQDLMGCCEGTYRRTICLPSGLGLVHPNTGR